MLALLVDLLDIVGDDFEPELAGVRLESLGEFRPVDMLESGIVFDFGGIGDLPAG